MLGSQLVPPTFHNFDFSAVLCLNVKMMIMMTPYNHVFQEVDHWSFDVFSFQEATGDHALKFLVYDLLTRYDLINRFRVHTASCY